MFFFIYFYKFREFASNLFFFFHKEILSQGESKIVSISGLNDRQPTQKPEDDKKY